MFKRGDDGLAIARTASERDATSNIGEDSAKVDPRDATSGEASVVLRVCSIFDSI